LVLAVPILGRTSFGMQYRSVGAVGPATMAGLGLNYTDLGTLIGGSAATAALSTAARASAPRLLHTERFSYYYV
jgi:hypothetical protein